MYAVLFDIDGTLLQTGGAGQLAFAETFAAEFGISQLAGDIPFAGRSDRAIAFDLMRRHGIPPSEGHWQRFRKAYLDRLPSALVRRQGQVLPGVVALLDELLTYDHALLGILTGNVAAGAAQKLTRYELASWFAFGGYGDDSDQRCDIAATALREAQREAQRRTGAGNGDVLTGAMVIGDTVHDISCARSINAFAVAVPTGNTPAAELEAARPDLLLNDLSDPSALLEIVRRR